MKRSFDIAVRGRAAFALALVATLGALASSCAYYNTFYLARKYYDIAALRQPYVVDRSAAVDNQNFNKSIDYSKKVIGQYPKSKWVDDAYLLWARSLLGKEDPRQTVTMLQDFDLRYPKSPLKAEAKFYLGVAYRRDHKHALAARTLEEFVTEAPRHELAPYAHLERARALRDIMDYTESAAAATRLLERWPKSRLQVQARRVRAESYYLAGDYERALADYHFLGLNAGDDDERLAFLFREAECLEAARAFDRELALLRNAQSHEIRPITPPPSAPAPASPAGVQSPPPSAFLNPNDRYGRLMVRIGTAKLRKGEVDAAVDDYRSVVRDYPGTPLAAEAQYRIAYAYETAADNFDQARAEYGKVQGIASSTFADSAQKRLASLERLAKFASTIQDTVEGKAEAAFLLAEQYLFQINKPERALEEYRKIEQQFQHTPWAAKAIVAQAWVLSRKLDRRGEADSLFWVVVRKHAATEAQLAARDYLEMEGAEVPEKLIKLPVLQLAHADTVRRAARAPETPTAVVDPVPARADSLGPRPAPTALVPGATLLHGPAPPPPFGPPAPGAATTGPAPLPAPAPAVTAAAPRDTSLVPARSDSTSAPRKP